MGKKDGIRHGTQKYCVFNCSSLVFSGKNRNIIYPILKYSKKYVIFCHVHVFFPTDFAGFCGPVQFLVDFVKSRNSRRPELKRGNVITAQEYNNAKQMLIKAQQTISYASELKYLKQDSKSKHPSIIQQLDYSWIKRT